MQGDTLHGFRGGLTSLGVRRRRRVHLWFFASRIGRVAFNAFDLVQELLLDVLARLVGLALGLVAPHLLPAAPVVLVELFWGRRRTSFNTIQHQVVVVRLFRQRVAAVAVVVLPGERRVEVQRLRRAGPLDVRACHDLLGSCT